MKFFYSFALIAIFLVLAAFSLVGRESGAQGQIEFHGWGWSSNIGWVSMNCQEAGACAQSGYKVEMNPVNGRLSGYAWSSNIGWIRFDPAGPYPEDPQAQATVNTGTGAVTGWARACSVFISNCSGTLKSEGERGGWDGWIKMSGFNYPSPYFTDTNGDGFADGGITYKSSNASLIGNAWGSLVVGWLNFVNVSTSAFDFLASVSGDITALQGGQGSNTLTLTLISGATAPVSLAANGLPQGASALFAPQSCSPTCSSTHTITTQAATPAGSYPITITATSAFTPPKTISYTLNVIAKLFVDLTASPSSGSAPLTSTLTAQVTISAGSGDYTYTFDCDGSGATPPLAPIITSLTTASAKCTYTSPTAVTASVLVTRQGAEPGSDTVLINLKPPLPKFKEVAPR